MIAEIVLLCAAAITGERVLNRKKKTFPLEKKTERTIDCITSDTLESDPEEKQPHKVGSAVRDQKEKLDHFTGISNVSFAVTAIGALLYPPLSILCVPAFLYMGYPVFKSTYNSIIRNKTINGDLISALFISGALITGNLFATSVSFWLYFNVLKALKHIEVTSKKSLTGPLTGMPEKVWIVIQGAEVEFPYASLEKGQTIAVSAGETVPADGLILEGKAIVDEHILTGESTPVEKKEGVRIFASTLMLSGKIFVRVENTGNETVAASMTKILDKTAKYRTRLQKKGESVVEMGTLPTLIISAVAYPIRGFGGMLSVLNAGFGYNMRLTAPLTMLNFMTLASANGILFKQGKTLDILKDIDTIVFDKNGALTITNPEIIDVHGLNGCSIDEIITLAASTEENLDHPIAVALRKEARQRNLGLFPVDSQKAYQSKGVSAVIDGALVRVGSRHFIESAGIIFPDSCNVICERNNSIGNRLVFVAVNDLISGVVELRSGLRPEIGRVVMELKKRDISLFVISSEHDFKMRYLSKDLELDGYFAEIQESQKRDLIDKLQNGGKTVLYVGDGLNDADAMKKAHVSVSLNGASDIMNDTAQVVMMNGSLDHLPYLFHISDELEKSLKTGYVLSIVPGVICVGAVFLFDFGLVSTAILYNMGLVAGLGNAMMPIVKEMQHIR